MVLARLANSVRRKALPSWGLPAFEIAKAAPVFAFPQQNLHQVDVESIDREGKT